MTSPDARGENQQSERGPLLPTESEHVEYGWAFVCDEIGQPGHEGHASYEDHNHVLSRTHPYGTLPTSTSSHVNGHRVHLVQRTVSTSDWTFVDPDIFGGTVTDDAR